MRAVFLAELVGGKILELGKNLRETDVELREKNLVFETKTRHFDIQIPQHSTQKTVGFGNLRAKFA